MAEDKTHLRHAALEDSYRFTYRSFPIPIRPNYNASPTQTLPICLMKGLDEDLVLARWGLIPSWWRKDTGSVPHTFNTRAETIDRVPMFRESFRKRRCLVPMNGYYEWQRVGSRKVRHFIRTREPTIFACAGIWDEWRRPDGERMFSFSIVTCPASELAARIHNLPSPRMPVILQSDAAEHWIDDEVESSTADLKALLQPHPGEDMIAYPVAPSAPEEAQIESLAPR